MECEVTGVRHRMGDGLTLEEKTQMAEQFVTTLPNGTPVILAAEPDNEYDSEAIAVYMDFTRHIGYIKHESCREVKKCLDEYGQCDAVVSGNDGHLTIFLTIPNGSETSEAPTQSPRKLPDFPLPQGIVMSSTNEEKALQVVATKLVRMTASAETADLMLTMAEHYLPLSRLSICYEDDFWRDHVMKQLRQLSRQQLTPEQKQKLNAFIENLRKTQGDFHRTHEHWQERIFKTQLKSLRKHSKAALIRRFEQYANTAAGGRQRLLTKLADWFADMPYANLNNYEDHDALARRFSYMGISRKELYEVYSALLLLEDNDVVMTSEDLVEQTSGCFYNDQAAAREFLERIRGMKNREITKLVNDLVGDRVISDLSKGRPLWTILHDNQLYTATESNWDQQIK